MSQANQSDVNAPENDDKKPFFRLKSVNLQVFVMLAAIAIIMLFFTFTTEGAYLSARNISNLLRQTAITGILAVGMVFVIISAEIDLSVGSMMGLLGGAAAIFDVWLGWPLPLTIVVTLALGLVLGAWNGWWVAYRKVPSFIVTLAGMLAFRGILIGITNGTTVSPTSNAMSQIGQSYLSNGLGFGIGAIGSMLFVAWQWHRRSNRIRLGLPVAAPQGDVTRQSITAVIVLGAIYLLNDYRGVPTPVLILTALMLVGIFMATRTAFGRRIYAIGGNIDAARLSGVNVERTKLAVFAINGLMVAIAGLILSSRLGAGSPSAGNIAELDAIAACVIGGTSLAGGIGSVAGAVMGAFIMASLDNGMSMLDVPTFWQYIVKGAILLLAVWMDSATKRRV
ncbi:xylose ABC transporter permease XylH [Yersinia massiliensis]|uniref:xylose ABC transporter permease XylH n=1 Tax=Yersinia massiliensis TaxID=419257 RepID=UPI000C1487DF|nr:xylose ABC transporter permease XylH [Yersinia massiliensis]PHZ24311.1 sugar ABC transporter permease [Yersinia massiliensis]